MDVLRQVRKENPIRCQQCFGHTIKEWSHTDWATAVAGETGELCNLVKKVRRGDKIDIEDIAREAADIVIYLDMLCQSFGIDLSNSIVNKFNETSHKVGYKDESGRIKEIYYY